MMDFNLHPIFMPYKEYFTSDCKMIQLNGPKLKDEEYGAFVTDFSSYVFNFAYLKRNIVYFVPDYIEFRAGLNQYWELDLPFEDAFGPLVLTADDMIAELEKMIQRDFKLEPLYEDRMDNFFLPMDNCMDAIYRAVHSDK